MTNRLGHKALAAGLTGLGISFGALSASHWGKGPPASGDANVLRALPLNIIGITGYYAGSLPIPRGLRDPVYKAYCSCVGCDVTEVSGSLRDFRSLSEFFARQLDHRVRPIDKAATLIVPCDGTVIAAGPVGAYGAIEVKQIRYRIRDLLGADEREPLAVSSVAVADRAESGARLWYTVIHIEPGQCHRFASPASWDVTERRRIGGYLLWLNPAINGLYTQNERLVMLGKWQHGLFCMAAVGAAGRGSLAVEGDSETFRPQLRPKYGIISRLPFEKLQKMSPGQPMGGFKLGSAIVLVFEAPEQSFRFHVKSGDCVKLGAKLATLDASQAITAPERDDTDRFKEGPQAELSSRARFRRAW